MNLKNKRIWIAGSRGLVGSACLARFKREDCTLINDPHRNELDLRDADKVDQFVSTQKPDVIILAAAKVGGLLDNATHSDEFYNDNIAIQNAVMNSAAKHDVQKLVFLGSSCIYPRDCPQPIKEEYLGTGALEETNEAYARAKIEGIELIQKCRRQGHDFISLMPCNLYGSNDHFMEGARPHVIPALMHKLYTNPDILNVWGTGKPLREFMHVDDLADAVLFCTQNYSDDMHLNVGTGTEISIADLVKMLVEMTNYKGEIVFDPSKPDGTPRKLMDSSRLYKLGWKPSITLQEGLATVWTDYLASQAQFACYSHG